MVKCKNMQSKGVEARIEGNFSLLLTGNIKRH